MVDQLRINFFGAPCRGKSETAARVFSELRSAHINAGLVQEWIKQWALENRPVQQFDQIYVFGKQHHAEYNLLKAGVKNVVTDSPVWLSVFYAPHDQKRAIAQLIRDYDDEYPSFNILLLRDDGDPYEREGRYNSEAAAQQLEDKLIPFLHEVLGAGNFQVFRFGQKEEIKQAVLAAAIK
jgi:hypothetical protein